MNRLLIIVFVILELFCVFDVFAQWNIVYNNPGDDFYGFNFVDSLNGWFIGDFSISSDYKIIRTTDGGSTFEPQNTPTGNYSLSTIFMEDLQSGWAASGRDNGSGRILHTTDSGINWIRLTHPAPTPVYWGEIAKVGNSIWFAGAYGSSDLHGIIMKTSDMGQSWQLTLFPSVSGFGGITVFDSLNFIVSGSEGLLDRTTDGGNSWIAANIDLGFQVDNVAFVNGEIGYALMTDIDHLPIDSHLYITSDGGLSWNLQFSWQAEGWKPGLSVVPNTDQVFVGGDLGSINGIIKSTNSGITWDTILQNSTNYNPVYIKTPDENHGWAVCLFSVIYRYDYESPPPTNHAPIFTGSWPDTVSVFTDSSYNWNFEFQDVDDDTLWTIPGDIGVPGLTALENSTPGIGTVVANITGQPISLGLHTATIQVRDNNSAIGQLQFMVEVNNVTIVRETPPVFSTFLLLPNYPNPFNPNTTIEFSIPQTTNVNLKIFNLLGQELITLLDEIREVGTYRINFDAKELNSGMYFYTLEAGGYKETRKMILIK